MTSAPPHHVFITADTVGGVWTYALDLAAGLRSQNISVTLGVLGPAPSKTQQLAASTVGANLISTGLTPDWLEESPEALRHTSAQVARLASDVGADLVHLNSPALAADAKYASAVVGVCHSCLATWWRAVRGGEMPGSFRWRTELLRLGYRTCDALVAPTKAFAATTAEAYGVQPVVVHNGHAWPTTVALPKEDIVLTSGRLWDEGKNLMALDRAAAFMRGRVEAAGALRGPGGQTASARAVASLGQLDAGDLAQRLRSASVFASLSLYEPFGLGVLEAAQAQCALVLSDIPTFRELWDGAAIFVPHDDVRRVAQTLDRLLGGPDEARRLGALAAARATRFTQEAMVEGTLAIYRSALAARRRGAAA